MTRIRDDRRKKRKRQSVISIDDQQGSNVGGGSDSEGVIGDNPDANLINRSLNALYLGGVKNNGANSTANNTPMKENSTVEEKAENEASKEIERALKKKARLKERYLYSPLGTFDDIGGLDEIIEQLKEYLDPLRDEYLKSTGFDNRKSILISGVPGVGKSKLVDAIVNHLDLPCLIYPSDQPTNQPESDSSFRNVVNLAKSLQPCIIFMDKLELIAPMIENSRQAEREKISSLIRCLEQFNKEENNEIILIGTTCSLSVCDSDFLMAAQFDEKIHIEVPDDKARSKILSVVCKTVKLAEDVNFNELGLLTPGYVGADLRDLVRKVGSISFNRVSNCRKKAQLQLDVSNNESMETLEKIDTPNRNDFIKAMKLIKPSLKREGFASIPPVTWDDIGGCDHIRDKLLTSVLIPVNFPSYMKETLWPRSSGILLHGPPGCGKTSIAKALANEGGINFISVRGPEVLNMYVGESERRIRAIFERAAKAKPCVIFFDEIDALCTARSSSSERSNVNQSVLSQLLTEMDGFENNSCKVLATTNRLDVLDSALLRPGRFDTVIYVGIPDPVAKLEILKALTRNGCPPLSSDISLEKLANDQRLKNFTGADLKGLLERAHSVVSLEMYKSSGGQVESSSFLIKPHHIETALLETRPSVTESMLAFYMKTAK